ncbi:uncharacterized protein ACNLHF_002859 isoform 3-T5 [Anomaloglossus baeobatrachus]
MSIKKMDYDDLNLTFPPLIWEPRNKTPRGARGRRGGRACARAPGGSTATRGGGGGGGGGGVPPTGATGRIGPRC